MPSPRLTLVEEAPTQLSDSQEQELLIRYAVTRSPVFKAKLTERFLPVARALAYRYRLGCELDEAGAANIDDLVQVAHMGLVDAIDGFDPALGQPFRAYATPVILGELRRHFRDRVWT